MDLNVSPDLDAWVCYVIVAGAGAWCAYGQISKRLGGIEEVRVAGIEGIWFYPRIWLLFAAYFVVPLGLFWLLDRTGAIADSSLFAALLVGFGYERIITGGSQTLRAPAEASQFWTPFLAYADGVEQRVRRQIARDQARLLERVVSTIVKDPKRYSDLEVLAKGRTADINALEGQLAKIDATAATRGDKDVLEQKTRVLYGVMVTIPDGHELMLGKGIIDQRLYRDYVKRIGPTLRRIFIAATLVVVLIVVGVRLLHPDYNQTVASYYVWRVSKTNSSDVDQFRARRQLLKAMDDPAIKELTTKQLAMLLRRPGLPMERVDLVLQILLESRLRPEGNPALPAMLVRSLRTNSVDARTRINDVLLLLAKSCDPKFVEPASPWKPNEGDSTATLENKIGQWEQYWAVTTRSCNTTNSTIDLQDLPRN